jgi:WD40 repeat protein
LGASGTEDVAKSFGRIAFSHDGRLLAGEISSGRLGSVIKFWDLTTETEKAILERRSTATNPPTAKTILAGHTDQISALLFSSDDKTLISGSWDKTVRLWDVASGKVVQTVSNGLTPVLAAANSKDGKWLAFASTGFVKLFDLEKRELSLSIKAGSSAIGENNAIAFSPDGKRLVGALRESKDHFIKSWDVKSGAELFSLLNKQNRVKALAFTSDGKRLVMARRDLKVWEATQDVPRTVGSSISDEYEALAINPDGETVATQYDDYRKIDFGIKLWDLSNDEKSFAFPAHGNSIRALALVLTVRS